jgi:adenylate cyclase
MTRLVAMRNMIHNNSDTTPTQKMPAESETGLDIEALSPRQLRTVLVCDVVESVRWMEHDEDNAITRWSQFAAAVRSRIAPEHAGSVVKSTGDGLRLEFESAPQAVAAANAMQKLSAEGNAGFEPERQMHLRVGIHQTQVRRDAHDLYGHGVNLAARISTLAGPGEIIVTPEVRDHLTDSLDGDIEDMGECYLKHLNEPQRVYRVGEVSAKPILNQTAKEDASLQPRIAVLHFDDIHSGAPGLISGLVADGLIDSLSKQSMFKVISKLTSLLWSDKGKSISDIGASLQVAYILSGSIYSVGQKYLVRYELSAVRGETVLLTDRYEANTDEIFLNDGDLFHTISNNLINSISQEEYRKTQIYSMPSLSGYSLLLGGIKTMHQTTKEQFIKSYDLLEHLILRHPKAPIALSWLAKWHVLASVRGLNTNSSENVNKGLSCTSRALDLWPDCSLALAMEGFVYTHLVGDVSMAKKRLDQAIQINPSESLAWLFRSVVNSLTDSNQDSVVDCETAKSLSPYDPLMYFFESLQASAYLSNMQHDKAIFFALRSLRLNKHHSPTLRVLMTAHYELNQIEEARRMLSLLTKEQPGLTMAGYLGEGSNISSTKKRCADAMRALGLS